MAALKKALDSFVALNFPLKSTEFIFGSPQYNDYIQALDKMFEPYAKYWITPLTELILRMKDSEQPGTEGINYFIVDLVVTMLSWNSTALPEDRYLTSKLLEFVMTRAQHRNRSVFKNNLEIIKTMVEIWKSRLEVPSKVIVDNLSNPDPTKKDNAVGIQLLGIIAANGLSLSHDATADKERFYSCLTNNLTFKYKEVYAAAAEVIGLLLKQAADVQKVFDGTLHDMVSEKLMSLVSSARPEPDKFITCVHKLQQNYPPIADRFVNQILFKLPSVYGDFKTYCLEILCSRAENITNLFTELKTKGLKDILTCRDEGSQVAVLKILQRLLKKLTVAELQFIFPSVTAFITHPSILCRELMYDILIWIYDMLRLVFIFQFSFVLPQAKERTKAARESRVVMYRKYRTGDLPDIQIKFSELIAPLQAVAQRDSTFAKKLFSVLFRGIFSQIEKKLSVPEAANVASDINTAVNNMVSSSTKFFPAFISSIQDICYHEHKLSIDPTSVSAACLTSLQQPIGIMLLEKQLLQSEDSGQSSRKRARGLAAPPSQETITWIELSRLYRSLGDYDVLRGIFTGHIGTKPITQKALEAEARGDFSQALKLYNEAIATESWPDGEPQREEEDLWDDGRLQCFANLTQWENVEKFSLLSIDDGDTPDIDKVWTDPFFQEHYLPYLITSKLKLQCQRMEDQSLNSFVTRAMRNNDWAALLQSRHSDSLALMYLLQDDYDRALYFTGYFEQSFLMDWAGLDSTMSSSRSAKLQPLQKMAEMQEFLEFIAQEENFSSTNAAESMFNKWSYRFPDPRLHPIVVWDDIVTNRIVYMRKILRKFETADSEERSGICLGGLRQSILQHEVQLHLRMANTAKEQGNYQVGNKCLREALKLIPEDDYSLQISWSHVYAKMNHKKIQSLTDKEAVETAVMIVGQLDKFCDSKILENEPLRALEQHILRSQTFDIITKAIFADGMDESLICRVPSFVACFIEMTLFGILWSVVIKIFFVYQALWYPFKISSEQFVFDNSKEGKTSQDAVKSLQSALESPLMNDFISALEQLTDPEMSFKDWCDGSMRQLLENKDKRTDAQAIRDCYKSMFQNLFESGTRAQNTSQIRGNDFGPVRKRFAQEFSDEVQKLFGKEGEKLIGLKVNQFMNQGRAVHRKMEEKGSRSRPVSNLKDYSPWLFHFQSINYTHALEIPGQYTGREKPLPEYHVKITGFDERVLILSSIRKPKRIIIRGDDEKDHFFLVKGGEDLRLDQRIEQLFGLMNDVMTSYPACSQRGLRLRTYQVIPMTPRVGLIEWIQNTKPFKEVLKEAMTPTERDNYEGNGGPCKRHTAWIGKFKGSKTLDSVYGEMYKKANRTETEKSFQQTVGLVPWDLLRRSFLKLAASPEAFLILRSHFAKTHSCLSICQYILGIGDRHLSNFMVDMETGEMIGIDFGHAFGSATQFLRVPELMPFRLTRQFINLMLPLKESGTLQSVMVHTLRALRSNHELLVNTMDVFIKEPSLDWQVFARRQARSQGINTDDGDVAWYPRQKIQNAKKKLEGFNPAYVMRDDLALGHEATSWYKFMEAVCLGDAKANIRAREPESGLSVESQVACLIDHATDPNILGRTYAGWEPWM
ncbi:PREDICTED: DNA-dependent protein kinase catalytic subunit-like [Acropora digitifera]|uniref:DNA-dependent protein kinase catalytic subunit-like n=1 Tax=Acropora digitifera TaxID=70779 RepID=UPI00077A2D50|nr:PREDICTED: DNA-dependent protein kinase catalytic subunit-like [Acropora digitifera]